jgi:hypothetical protein
MHQNSPNIYLYTAYKLEVTYTDVGTSDKVFCGTCFFIFLNNHPYMVTNRHNIDASYKDHKYKYLTIKNITISGYFTDDSWHKLTVHNCNFTIPDNWDEDLAVVILLGNQTLDPPPPIDQELWPSLNGFDISLVATKEWLDTNLKVCDAVTFPGYPPFHDWNGTRPIARMGSIASDPLSDYCWQKEQTPARRIAYEAMSFSGSSGSPVIALPTKVMVDREFRELSVIGVNAGHVKVDEDQHKQHSGISYFFKSSAILDLLETASNHRIETEAKFIAWMNTEQTRDVT